jgi:hypothetical protein
MARLLLGVLLAACCPQHDCDDVRVRVTVVAVLATPAHTKVDPELRDLAIQVQKRNGKLTGFTLHASEGKSIAVGDSATFKLVDKQELKVKVDRPKGEDGKIGLTIKPPELGEVTYACTCDKYFPVVTPYKTATGETLIVAVMAKPCTQGKKGDKR